jgi:hypothetical protein
MADAAGPICRIQPLHHDAFHAVFSSNREHVGSRHLARRKPGQSQQPGAILEQFTPLDIGGRVLQEIPAHQFVAVRRSPRGRGPSPSHYAVDGSQNLILMGRRAAPELNRQRLLSTLAAAAGEVSTAERRRCVSTLLGQQLLHKRIYRNLEILEKRGEAHAPRR